MSSLDISGLYPPIATPFNKDESIAYDKLEDNIQKWNTIPFKGMLYITQIFKCSCVCNAILNLLAQEQVHLGITKKIILTMFTIKGKGHKKLVII